MFAGLPRWLLIGLVLTAGLLLVALFSPTRLALPEDCRTAEDAMAGQDFDRAIEHYFLCLEAGDLPQGVQAQIFFQLGNAYSAKGNHHQAIEDYGTALDLDPAHGWAYNNRCWSRGLLRQSTEALDDCNEALKLLPDRPEILDSRALAYWQLGQMDKARADLARAHEIEPAFPTADERFAQFAEMFP
ncbi:MAG: tetratricopeptide repeat protein [Kiloniellales bacterium]|nr:tetratricopeptide repeat protein [Kiloniellales bacterium]